MMEENVVSAAGCFNLESVQRLEHQIRTAGFEPVQRNSWYGLVDERYQGPRGPLTREDAATHAAAPQAWRERVRPLEPDVVVIYHATNDLAVDTNGPARAAGPPGLCVSVSVSAHSA